MASSLSDNQLSQSQGAGVPIGGDDIIDTHRLCVWCTSARMYVVTWGTGSFLTGVCG
jgi:hypothetical protein